jgi:hypothetical protein
MCWLLGAKGIRLILATPTELHDPDDLTTAPTDAEASTVRPK